MLIFRIFFFGHSYLIIPLSQFLWISTLFCKVPLILTIVTLHIFLVEFLLAGFPFHSELTVPSVGTVVRKAQKGECFRFAVSAVPSVAFG